jgi:hypothetical protein
MAFHFPQLIALDLSNNALTGAVPWDLGQGAAKMQYLILSGNNLRGGPSVRAWVPRGLVCWPSGESGAPVWPVAHNMALALALALTGALAPDPAKSARQNAVLIKLH